MFCPWREKSDLCPDGMGHTGWFLMWGFDVGCGWGYADDWKALASQHHTAPFRLVPSYVQKELCIPRTWVWSTTKNRTLEQFYNCILALHLWAPMMIFPRCGYALLQQGST